jgi:predicted enzyme related to lactoylglutathione lyase
VLKCVDRILLQVPNVAAATKFYTKSLGLRTDRQQSGAAALKFEEGDTELILHDDRQRPEVEIVFGVKNVRQMYERRDELGITFLTQPAQAGRGWRANIRDPFGNVLAITDRGDDTHEGDALRTGPEDGALFDDAAAEDPAIDKAALIEVYVQLGRTADDLPYTRHFEELYTLYTRRLPDPKPTANEVWRQLLTLRKSGKLPKLGPATSKPPALEPEDREHLRNMLGSDIGRRDRLPYTEQFDELVIAFNKRFARPFTPHVIWRLVATLAK